MKNIPVLNSPHFQHITIVGVGLIGGSLGLAIKQRFASVIITGVDEFGVLRKALRRGAIDKACVNLAEAIPGADLILLAAPIRSILKLLSSVAKYVSPHAVVSDVGSVKQRVIREAEKLFPHGNFIGGHPMAGVEISGIEAAHPLLFENAMYVVTPTKKTSRLALRRFSAFLAALGARVVRLDAQTHDEVASAVSHLPQLTAIALMNVVGKRHASARNHLRLAAGGFRDLTRIASSRFDIWKDILPLNKREIKTSIDLLVRELRAYSKMLGRESSSTLSFRFAQARHLRNEIPKNMKGFLHPLAEVYVFLKDQPGMLAKMTAALAKAKINIKDMELMKVREGSGGTFRLAFESAEIVKKAAGVLRRVGFEVNE